MVWWSSYLVVQRDAAVSIMRILIRSMQKEDR